MKESKWILKKQSDTFLSTFRILVNQGVLFSFILAKLCFWTWDQKATPLVCEKWEICSHQETQWKSQNSEYFFRNFAGDTDQLVAALCELLLRSRRDNNSHLLWESCFLHDNQKGSLSSEQPCGAVGASRVSGRNSCRHFRVRYLQGKFGHPSRKVKKSETQNSAWTKILTVKTKSSFSVRLVWSFQGHLAHQRCSQHREFCKFPRNSRSNPESEGRIFCACRKCNIFGKLSGTKQNLWCDSC